MQKELTVLDIIEGNKARANKIAKQGADLQVKLDELKSLGAQNSVAYAEGLDKLDKIKQKKHEAQVLADSDDHFQVDVEELNLHNKKVQLAKTMRETSTRLHSVERLQAKQESRFVFTKKGLKALRKANCLRSAAYRIQDTLMCKDIDGNEKALGAISELVYKDNNPNDKASIK